MNSFDGIWIPLVTPFRHGGVDLDAAQRFAAHVSRSGIAGVVVGATTGEASALDDDERARLLHAVIEATQDRCQVMAGVSGNHTAAVVRAVERLSAVDIAGLLISTPHYVRPSQEGMRRHFEAVADVSAHPIVLYNIPYRTGVNLDIGTAKALAGHPNIVAIKEAGAGNMDQLMDLIRETPLAVLSGEDHLIFVAVCLGGRGAISAAAHIRPDLFVRMYRCIQAGELAAARALWDALLPVIRTLFCEPNPAPLKAALAMEGWMTDEVRLPLTPASPACRARLERTLAELAALPVQ